MPKNIYYDDVKLIKKPLKKRIKSFLKFFLIIIVFAGVLLSSVYLSKALTIKNISVALVYGDKVIKIKKSSYYAVALGRYDEYSDAEKVALGSTIQGASGYIWRDNDYIVIGNVYKNINEANSVMNNLKDSNYDISIFEINFGAVNIRFEDLDNKQVSLVKKSLDFIDNLYLSLFDYSIAFDKGESTNFAISSYISSIRGECKVNISNMQSIKELHSENINDILESLIQMDTMLNTLILKTIDNKSTNYSLKNGIANVVRIKYDLYQNLSK